MLRLPIKTGIQLVGGPTGTADILMRPPWQGEQIEAVMVFCTAYGNSAANLLYASPDSEVQLLQGALTLKGDNGIVVAINGAGTTPLMHSPMPVSQFLRISPAPGTSGQIYLGFYWQTWTLPGVRVSLHTPDDDGLAARAREEMKEENEVWRQVRALPPLELLKQNPAHLQPSQRQALERFAKMTDMRRNPSEPIKPVK